MFECHECGKMFKSITNTHLKHHGMTTTEYKRKYSLQTIRSEFSKDVLKEMSERMKRNRRNGVIVPPPQSESFKKNQSERMKLKNPMWNKDVVRKMQATKKTKTYDIRRTDEQKKRYSLSKLGDKNPMKRPEVAMKNAKAHNRKKSGIEEQFDRLIFRYKLPLKYVGNNKIWIGYKNPDYIDSEGRNLVVEVTSDAYNRIEEQYEEKRIQHFKKYNYRCITIRYTRCNKGDLDNLKTNLGNLLTKIIYEKSSYQIYHSTTGEVSCIQH